MRWTGTKTLLGRCVITSRSVNRSDPAPGPHAMQMATCHAHVVGSEVMHDQSGCQILAVGVRGCMCVTAERCACNDEQDPNLSSVSCRIVPVCMYSVNKSGCADQLSEHMQALLQLSCTAAWTDAEVQNEHALLYQTFTASSPIIRQPQAQNATSACNNMVVLNMPCPCTQKSKASAVLEQQYRPVLASTAVQRQQHDKQDPAT